MAKPLYVEKTDSDQDSDSSERASEEEAAMIKVHHQPTTKTGYNPNKYGHVHVRIYYGGHDSKSRTRLPRFLNHKSKIRFKFL